MHDIGSRLIDWILDDQFGRETNLTLMDTKRNCERGILFIVIYRMDAGLEGMGVVVMKGMSSAGEEGPEKEIFHS